MYHLHVLTSYKYYMHICTSDTYAAYFWYVPFLSVSTTCIHSYTSDTYAAYFWCVPFSYNSAMHYDMTLCYAWYIYHLRLIQQFSCNCVATKMGSRVKYEGFVHLHSLCPHSKSSLDKVLIDLLPLLHVYEITNTFISSVICIWLE